MIGERFRQRRQIPKRRFVHFYGRVEAEALEKEFAEVTPRFRYARVSELAGRIVGRMPPLNAETISLFISESLPLACSFSLPPITPAKPVEIVLALATKSKWRPRLN